MASRYLIQIVDRQTGEVALFEPGLAVEADLITESVNNAVRVGIGFGRSSAQSAAAMRQGMEEALFALKAKVQP